MRCERVCKLISGYVGDDLSRGDGAAVQAHLLGCESCSAVVHELRESLEFVRGHSEARGSTADYDAIRDAVLRELRVGRQRRDWRPILAFAACTAVVALAFSLILIATVRRHVDETAQDPPLGQPAVSRSPAPEEARTTPYPPVVAPTKDRRQRTRRRNSVRAPRGDDHGAPADVDSEAMMRVEFQTSDPTVRIIWFVPREAGAVSRREIGGS